MPLFYVIVVHVMHSFDDGDDDETSDEKHRSLAMVDRRSELA